MPEQIKKCAINSVLVLMSVAVFAAVSDLKRSEQIIRPPEPTAMATVAPEKIVIGMCTFGDCPTAVNLTKPYKTLQEDCKVETSQDLAETSQPEEAPESVWFPEEEPEEPVWEATETAYYSPEYFCTMGLIDWGGWTWSWYSERVLPGGGLNIPGRYTAGGYVRDGDGHICLASDVLAHGTVIDTPFGSAGKVYDDGVGNDYTIDVYVGW